MPEVRIAGSACEECDGKGCAKCYGTSEQHLHECPLESLTPDVLAALRVARYAERGNWPVPGGWLDQTEGCLSTEAIVRREWAAVEKQVANRNGKARS